MKSTRRRIVSDYSDDSGLSLIEVVAAVIIIVIVALAGASLTITGIQSATSQQRQQVAVTIANGAMETVSGWSVSTNSTTTVSNLYTGRYTNAVTNAFTNNSTKPGVAQTYAAWDPTATATSTPAIAITVSPPAQNATNYTTTTLIGTCYEPVAGGNCSKITGQATDPATVPAGYSKLIRIMVIVSWTAGSTCAVSGCYYEATTLADPHVDLQWVTH
jgi:Tfp pilus assembly protein PilV